MASKVVLWLIVVLLGMLALTTSMARRRAPEQVQILAPDVEIHLGDQADLTAPWKPLYRFIKPSTIWQGEFFVRNPGNGEWLLSMEVLAPNDWGNMVRINNQRLQPGFLPGREFDFAATWSGLTFVVPSGVLQPELNVLSVQVDQSEPVFQSAGTFWEDLQFRNVTLRPRP